MLLRDLRLAMRHLWGRKLYTFIILLSLTIGFACTSLLVSFLISETNSDNFHVNGARSFQLFSNDPFNDNGIISYVPDYLPDYLKGNFAEVQEVVQLGTLDGISLETEAGEFHDIVLLSADSSFFSIFSFPITAGSSIKCLTPDRIILSEEKARVLFGKVDAVGKLVTLKTSDTLRTLEVSAVIGKSPEYSHLVFDALIAHTALKNKWHGGASYVLLNDSSQRASLLEKVNKDPQRPGLTGKGKAIYSLEPLRQSYFNAANKMTYMHTRNPVFIKMGIMACALILFMACFNFISLFLLSLQARRKEAGVKKLLGISWRDMMRASLLEVALYVLVAVVFAIVLISFLLPSFNSVTEASLALAYLSRVEVLLWVGGIVFVTGMSVVLFSMAQQRQVQTIDLLKNVTTSKVMFSKMLFTIQFVVSITLAICAITVIGQMDFLKNEPLGFNRNIVRLQSPGKKLNDRLNSLKLSLLQIKGIRQVSIATASPISGMWMIRYDLEDGKFYTPYLFSGDEDFPSTLSLTLLEGEFPSATRQGKVVNEKFVKYFNMRHPIGEKVPGTKDQIIGVVKDFTCTSFKDEIQPSILSYSVNNSRLLIDYSGQSIEGLLPQVEAAWKKIFPDYIFSYQVIEEELMKKYQDEHFFYKTVVAFAITTIVISCFGLFALSWAVTQSRTKEMGIRKVLGATVRDIMNLLTINFLRHIALAFLIAAPFGYYLMNTWLSHFARRIPLGTKVFVFTGVTVLLLALITMSIQTLQAARKNPVTELKND